MLTAATMGAIISVVQHTVYYTGSLIPSDHPRRQPFLTVAIALATVPQEGVGLWPVELGGVAAYGSHWHCNT